MKLIIFFLLCLGVSGANIAPRQWRGRPTGGGGWRWGNRPTSTTLPQTTAARSTTSTRAPSVTGGTRTTTVFVTATRPSSTARGSQVVVTTILQLPPAPTPDQPAGGNQGPKCGDNPIACIGKENRVDSQEGLVMLMR